MSPTIYRIMEMSPARFRIQRRVRLFGISLWWANETANYHQEGERPREFKTIGAARQWVDVLMERAKKPAKPRVVEYISGNEQESRT